MKPILAFLCLWSGLSLAVLTPPGESAEAAPKPAAALTLSRVVAEVLLHNPELRVFDLEVRAREARALQAGLRPNPQILLDTQDVFGSGPFQGADQSQNTVTLSQVIELGGKRARREDAARLNRDLARWDYETRRMDVLTRAAREFVQALAAQEQLRLAEELVQLSRKSMQAVVERVTAGKVSPIQQVKAEVALAVSESERDQARDAVQAAHRRLALSWGSSTPGFDRVDGDLYAVAPVPAYETLTARLGRNPVLARWATEMLHRQAQVDLETARAVPDVRVGAGARWFQETRDNSFIFEFSLPLQLFDRNQGAIAEARHRLEQADEAKRAAELSLNRTLSGHYTRLTQAFRRVVALKSRILPGAQKAFDAVNEGYRYGKFGFLELLDSQRTLFDARGQFLQALTEYHQARADVEQLTGEPLNPEPVPQTPGAKGGRP